ncbi:hypothetical protein A7M79_01295 [Acinetobacter baumannii]|uniref:hypothetical protein n=1 Tax=Acinetobacter baumannii TaxID=470 RepID=UPI0008DC635E|nr:hypothetical protein [Acinetobacter baumannii]OIH12151.1 hypothetical protein A7M79_01295 [Acinetobacter baumannii]
MNKSQKGFGYAEVLVALAISTIGLLAIYSMQLKWSVEALNSYKTSKAQLLATDMHNKMAISAEAKQIFAQAFSDVDKAKSYKNINCIENSCTLDQKIKEDAYYSYRSITNSNMKVSISKCRSTDRNCIYISWDNTLPISDDTNLKSCTVADNGTENYRKDANCVVMESF